MLDSWRNDPCRKPRYQVLWHNGLGGSLGMGHVGSSFSVSVLKNAYDPGAGSQHGIVSLPEDVLEFVSIVESFVESHA